jgi:hypothetical protein
MKGVVMPVVKNKPTEKPNNVNGPVNDVVKNHQNDPFVLKKVATAKELLNRPGMQEQLKKLAEKYD